MSDEKICSICQRVFTEFGNNAEPVNDGRCCDRCDWEVVIPARQRQMARDDRKRREQSEEARRRITRLERGTQ